MTCKYDWTIEAYVIKDAKLADAIKDPQTRLLAALLLKEASDSGVIHADVELLAKRFNTDVGLIFERLAAIERAGVAEFLASIADEDFMDKFRERMQITSSHTAREKAKAVTFNSKHQENMVNKYDNAGLR